MKKIKQWIRFTLLELVIAVALMALMISMVSMVLFSLVQEWSEIENQARVLREFQAIDRLVESSFRNAFTFRWTWPEGGGLTDGSDEKKKPPLLFVGEADRVYFTYRHPAAGLPPASLRYIQIYREGSQLMAAYRNTPILPADIRSERENMTYEVLANNVNSVDFLYAFRDYASGAVSWLNNWDTEELSIPIAIQMKVTWEDNISEVWLRRTASNGFAEAYDVREDEKEDENKPVEGLAERKDGNDIVKDRK